MHCVVYCAARDPADPLHCHPFPTLARRLPSMPPPPLPPDTRHRLPHQLRASAAP